MTNEPNLIYNNNSLNGIEMARADLYNEVLKYYQEKTPKDDKIEQLQRAIEIVNQAQECIVGLDYEDYLKRRFIEVGVELTRQLSCATKKPLVYP